MRAGPIRLFDKFVISHRDRGGDDYITRWRIIDTPWFGIFLHKIHRPDACPIWHDHPWSFIGFVLRGGYVESVRDPKTTLISERHVRWFNRKRLIDAHFIARLDRTPTTTLLFVGPTKRKWGYWRKIEHHWVWTPWDQDIQHTGHDATQLTHAAGAVGMGAFGQLVRASRAWRVENDEVWSDQQDDALTPDNRFLIAAERAHALTRP